ncbi:MAG: hypothetical protein N2F24_07835 [Deltaproteobacteria bacterium]
MTDDQTNGLISALKQEVAPDETRLKEILILSGMPETANEIRTTKIKGLPFHRQVIKPGS